jgi:hypothetical protein
VTEFVDVIASWLPTSYALLDPIVRESTSMTWSSSGRLIPKMDMATRYQFRVSTYLLGVLASALTAKGILLAARFIRSMP